MTGIPYIPETFTVHLGAPDSPAENVTLSFPDYIKNVASSEVYPTWPESALRANIYAQISFALNRFYTEWYRSRGYDFDITNSTAYDQAFVNNRVIYDNISAIVDDIFNSYIREQGEVQPFFAQYCNGTTVTCEGLSQWGTVPLAEEGLGAFDILTRFYGDDIELVEEAPVRAGSPSYSGVPLTLGSTGADVQLKQIQLNRISQNYPAIPKIPVTDGLFDMATERAVRAYQRIFGLTQDGVIGNATWNSLSYIYAAVKRLADLDSEGITLSELPQQRPQILASGDSGDEVRVLQYYLAVVAEFYNDVPQLTINGQYDTATENTVRAFQRVAGVPEDGIVGLATWTALYRAYRGIAATISLPGGERLLETFVLRQGDSGDEVRRMQEYLVTIATVYPTIPAPTVDGRFGPRTEEAVIAFQRQFGLEPDGVVDALTFLQIVTVYTDITEGAERRAGQEPGYTLTTEEEEGTV
ncbi:MAG: spore cortex-lytic protein [Ruminococcaceae bacterium]|nr:spore cortex-lytic protein [Oscillospiraceae bacterium]